MRMEVLLPPGSRNEKAPARSLSGRTSAMIEVCVKGGRFVNLSDPHRQGATCLAPERSIHSGQMQSRAVQMKSSNRIQECATLSRRSCKTLAKGPKPYNMIAWKRMGTRSAERARGKLQVRYILRCPHARADRNSWREIHCRRRQLPPTGQPSGSIDHLLEASRQARRVLRRLYKIHIRQRRATSKSKLHRHGNKR